MEIMNLHDLFIMQSRPATYLILNFCNWLSLKESVNFDIPEVSSNNHHHKLSGKKNKEKEKEKDKEKEDESWKKDHTKAKNFSDNSKVSFLSH